MPFYKIPISEMWVICLFFDACIRLRVKNAKAESLQWDFVRGLGGSCTHCFVTFSRTVGSAETVHVDFVFS